MRTARKELKYNETTDGIYTEIYLEKDDNVFLQCPKCGAILKFKIFFGDSIYLRPLPCEKCKKKRKEKASLERMKEIIERMIDENHKGKIKGIFN